MEKLYFVTGNLDKFAEVKAVLPNIEQLYIDLKEIQHIDSQVIIQAKLDEARKQISDAALIVEDNSLTLTGLNGLPGPLIKWFLKTVGNDGLFRMAEAFGNFEAEAKVVIGYSNRNGEVAYFEGVQRGTIVQKRGELGFAWDPIFKPEGFERTFGEMTQKEKNKISMRRVAVEKLKEYLVEISKY